VAERAARRKARHTDEKSANAWLASTRALTAEARQRLRVKWSRAAFAAEANWQRLTAKLKIQPA
jgi:hypothetical protein